MGKYVDGKRSFDKFRSFGGANKFRPYQNGGGDGGGGAGGRYPSARGDYNNDIGANLQAPDWTSVELRPFKKDFYVPHANIENRYIFIYH